MEKFNILVCSIIEILHHWSLERREPNQFLSIID
jgi:hypothetical protein